jgi:hypothetical protein
LNVYWVSAPCEVRVGAYGFKQIYPNIYGTEPALDMVDHFGGKPYPKKPRKLTLLLDKPKLPRPDFLGRGYKAFACNERAADALGDLFRASAEMLPATVKGEREPHHLINVTRLLPKALHKAKSTFDGRRLQQPAFHPAALEGDVSLFKITQDYGSRIYCVERIGRAADGEFKALVEQHGLKGLAFKLVWTDGRGPEPTPTPERPAKSNRPAGKVKPNATADAKKAKGDSTQAADRELTASERKDVNRSVQRGYAHLELAPDTPAAQTQKALGKAVRQVIKAKQRPDAKALADLAVNLGCLWGQTTCDASDWTWRAVKIGRAYVPAIVPPDRSHRVSPLHFMQRQLARRAREDSSTLLLFEMIRKRSKLSGAEPGALVSIG